MLTLPPQISLELTFRCNHGCLFCSCPWLHHTGFAGRELSCDEWIGVLDMLAAHGVKQITFTGGEPLLKEDFVKILTHAATLPFETVGVFSNGLLIDEYMLEIFQKYKIQWATSLPGFFSFKYLTNSPMSPWQLLEKVKLASEKKLHVSVSITVVRKNFWEVILTAILAGFHGAAALTIGPCMPEGRALQHRELLLSDKLYSKLLGRIKILNFISKIPVYFSYEQRCLCFNEDGSPTGVVPETCSAGKTFAVISPDGSIRKCLHSPQKISSVQEFLHKDKP